MAHSREPACDGEDPSLFDHHRYPEATKALAICATCTVVVECAALVRPQRSGFDGVAAGVVWRNGYKVRPDNSTRQDRFMERSGRLVEASA